MDFVLQWIEAILFKLHCESTIHFFIYFLFVFLFSDVIGHQGESKRVVNDFGAINFNIRCTGLKCLQLDYIGGLFCLFYSFFYKLKVLKSFTLTDILYKMEESYGQTNDLIRIPKKRSLR